MKGKERKLGEIEETYEKQTRNTSQKKFTIMNGQPENKKTTILKTDKLPQPNKIKQEIKLSLTVVYLNRIQTNHKSQLDMEG